MTQFISPGVYTIEKDLSAYISDLSSTLVGMVGTADIGPTGTPVLVTSQKDFVNIFGQLNPKHYLGYAALSYLAKGNTLWVTRVTPSDSKKALGAFVLPETYTPYAGEWVLESQTASDMTLVASDFTTATGTAKTVVLSASTSLPKFDFTDSTNATFSNSKVGSDLNSFVTTNTKSLITGNTFSITLGAGKGGTSVLTDLLVGDTATTVKLKVARSGFSATNSPVSAYAMGSLLISTSALPVDGTSLVVLGNAPTALSDTVVSLHYTSGAQTVNSTQTLIANLNSTVEATKLAALETLLSSFVSGSNYSISVPLLNSAVASNNPLNMALIAAILNAVIYTVNKTVVPVIGTYPKANILWTDLRVSLGNGVYGVGSITTAGASRGFKTVSTLTNSASEIIEIRLDSMVQGALGTFKYSTQIPAPAAPISVKDQVVSGQFTTGAYRPSWVMSLAGSSWVPTIVKLSSLGETDASNLAIILTQDVTNKTSDGSQNYLLKVYERVVSESISPTSVRLSDFSLVESYEGTVDVIQSKVSGNSRRISLKIDYTTEDQVDYTTGVVTPGVNTDGLTTSFVLQTSEFSNGVSTGLVYTLDSLSYVRQLTAFLTGGSAGSAITKSDIAGDSAAGTGVYSFANPEVIDINLIVVPGWSADPTVAKAMVSVCENRGDAMAIVDSPFGLNVQDVTSYRNTILGINSSYGAMYYPWVKVTDTVNKKDVFIPPSGPVAAQYAFNDQVSDVYFAPAGMTRGTITNALSTERTLTLGDRDQLALAGINPLHNDAAYGIYIKGQHTLQTATTALDRVNVRRLMLKLRKVIATASKAFEFEPGDSTTAYRLKQVAETVLEDHLRKGAIQQYTVDVGPNVNTNLTRENNELRMEISLIPTKTAERIIETFTILPQAGGVQIG